MEYKVRVTVPTGTVGSDLSGFPVMLRLSDLPPGFWDHVRPDGLDIRVEAVGGGRVPHDLLRFDYASKGGSLFFKGDVRAAEDSSWDVYYGGQANIFTPTVVSLDVANPGGNQDTSGWTNLAGSLGIRTDTPFPFEGAGYFFGGQNPETLAYQDVSIPPACYGGVDAGDYLTVLTWQQAGYDFSDNDTAEMCLQFYDAGGSPIGDRLDAGLVDFPQAWVQRRLAVQTPANARTVRIFQHMVRYAGTNCDGYIDAIQLQLRTSDPYGGEQVWSDYEAVQFYGESGSVDRTGKRSANLFGDPFCFSLVSTSPDVQSIQGVCCDGTNYYTIQSTGGSYAIRKWDASWNKVAENTHPITDTGLAGVNHLGDPEYHDGKLFIPIQDYPNLSAGPYVCVFNPDTLGFVEAHDISSNHHEAASICYCDRDGLFYIVDFLDGTKIHKYNPDFSHAGYVTPDLPVLNVQGIAWWHSAFWLQADLHDETVRMSYDGICSRGSCDPRSSSGNNNGYGGLFGPTNCDEYEGIGKKDDLLLTMRRVGTASYVDVWKAKDLPLCARAGIYTPNSINQSPRSYGIVPLTEFTLGVSGSLALKGTTHSALLGYLVDTNNRMTLTWRQNTAIGFGIWDNLNTWLMTNPLVNPALNETHRLHAVYSGTSFRKIYVDGALSNTQAPIKQLPATYNTLFVGQSYDSSSPWCGDLGFVYLRPGALSDYWLAAEYSNVNDPASFYAVGTELPLGDAPPDNASCATSCEDIPQVPDRAVCLTALGSPAPVIPATLRMQTRNSNLSRTNPADAVCRTESSGPKPYTGLFLMF